MSTTTFHDRVVDGEARAEEFVPVIVERLGNMFGGRALAINVRGSSIDIRYGVEQVSGTTPQTERWVGVRVTANFPSYSEGMSYMELSPELMTRTGRSPRRSGFWSPDINLSAGRSNRMADGAEVTCSSGPLLNGGEGPGRAAMFTGCLTIANGLIEDAEELGL